MPSADAPGAPALQACATDGGFSLKRFLARDPVQHIGVNVLDMAASKKFYAEVLGAEFVAEIDGITSDPWNEVLNGTALADGRKVPNLAGGDALHVAFYSLGNMAIELLRYYNVATGETFPGPLVGANEQGPAGMHICFNLAPDVDAADLFELLRARCADMYARTLMPSHSGSVWSYGQCTRTFCRFF